VGTYAGARLIGRRDHWTSLSFGAGLNARGAMEIIIATIGLNLGILTQDMFSIIVLMAMTTSLMAPPALRWVLRRVTPGEEEAKRLRREELASGSLVANIHRVLLPVRQRELNNGAVQTIEAHVLDKIGAKTALSLTLLNVAQPGKRSSGIEFLNELAPYFSQRELLRKAVENTEPEKAILEEARKDYDLMVFGASEERTDSDIVFTHLVDHLVRFARCPTIVIRGQRVQPDWNPRRILVPTNGSRAARNAAELGFALASEDEDEIFILHVVADDTSDYFLDTESKMLENELDIGRQVVNELRELGQLQGVHTSADIRVGNIPEAIILDFAREQKMDLIILGTDVRPGSSRLFLGPRVERILKNAHCPVIVFNS
ncbi:MAG: universal stress protein, partial [Chloroflexota bacterium]